MKDNFRKELENLINKHSMENESNTPDYILSDYLVRCLDAFDIATKDRDHWYRKPEHHEKDYKYERF